MSGGPVNAQLNAHVLRCPTRWSDVDENGHINNARLVGYIQEGIYDLFHHHAKAVQDSLFPAGFLIARHEIDYLEQLRHQPEPLLVRLTVERLGRSSAQVRVDVCRDPFTYMTARTVVVARDQVSGRSRKLSQSERRFLSEYLTVSSHTIPECALSRAHAPQPTATVPRPVVPRPAAPKPVVPERVAPKVVAQRVVAPKVVLPKPAAPKVVVPKPAAPKAVVPKPSIMKSRKVPLPSRLPARVLCRA